VLKIAVKNDGDFPACIKRAGFYLVILNFADGYKFANKKPPYGG